MDSGEPGESVTNGQTRHVQPPPSAALKARQQRPKKGWKKDFSLLNAGVIDSHSYVQYKSGKVSVLLCY